jgi:hypothetical protein
MYAKLVGNSPPLVPSGGPPLLDRETFFVPYPTLLVSALSRDPFLRPQIVGDLHIRLW